MKTCPYCGGQIQDETIVVCGSCGRDIRVSIAPTPARERGSPLSLVTQKRITAVLGLLLLLTPPVYAWWTRCNDCGFCLGADCLLQTATPIYVHATAPVPVQATPEPPATPIISEGITLGGITYQLPDGAGWCIADKSMDATAEAHYLTSFCQFTSEPSVAVDLMRLKTGATSRKDAIERYVQGYQTAGFEIQRLEFRDEEVRFTVGPVAYAMAQMSHPDSADPIFTYFASFESDGDYYLVQASLLQENTKAAFQFLLDSVDEIIATAKSRIS